jgi:hypothetical protein
VAYHEISTMDIWEVIRRWHTGQAIRQIARILGYDRKTVDATHVWQLHWDSHQQSLFRQRKTFFA